MSLYSRLLAVVALLLVVIIFPVRAFAIENPLTVPNNKIGVHILFPSELSQASSLINSSGGDWGYVTIPIQVNDLDLTKWQNFMDQAKQLHIIPILRIATTGDYFNTQVWSKPTPFDIVDFANFLNSLTWPTKNRYVIVFNEVNRYDEWGGSVDPADYANILSFAVSVFKSRSPDFFIISAGLDNGAPSEGTQYMNEFDYMRAMNVAVPGIFDQVDGMASHSYPNPAFAQPPDNINPMGTDSFHFEQQLAQSLDGKTLPMFITETGWSTQSVSDAQAASYYQDAITNVWNDPSIVAITPFLLYAGAGPFQQFSLVNSDGSFSQQYQTIKNLPKTKGEPVQVQAVLAATTQKIFTPSKLPTDNFQNFKQQKRKYSVAQIAITAFRYIINL